MTTLPLQEDPPDDRGADSQRPRGAPALVSVVIPCRNGALTLNEQLEALSAQTYPGKWEVVVIDNGSTDNSMEIARDWSGRLPDLRIHETLEVGVSHVRNAGVRAGSGDLIALADADDVVEPGWLEALVLASKDADLVGGRLDDLALNSGRTIHWRGRLPQDALMRPLDHLPFAPGCNCAVWRDVFEALGGWDPNYAAGSDDVDFSWRAQALGYTVGYARDAVTAYRYRDSLRATCRQFFFYGFTEVRLYRQFRSDGIRSYGLRALARTWWGLLRSSTRLARGIGPAGEWMREVSYHSGRAWGSVKLRTLLP